MISAKDYATVTNFLRRYKIVHGARDLNIFLLSHYKLAQELQKYEKENILRLERELLME